MRHGSLFSGIGGFDLAAEWAGFENVFTVEIDKFCNKILEKNFPKVERYYDIKDFNGREYRGRIDIISGGFPCQPFSVAGKRKGSEDERALFPEMVRVIGEVRPKWVVGENVGGIITIENGEYFEKICASLESEGYEVQPIILPASAFNAPHRRDRVWIIAKDTERERYENEWKEKECKRGFGEFGTGNGERVCDEQIASDSNAAGQQDRNKKRGRIQTQKRQGKSSTCGCDTIRDGITENTERIGRERGMCDEGEISSETKRGIAIESERPDKAYRDTTNAGSKESRRLSADEREEVFEIGSTDKDVTDTGNAKTTRQRGHSRKVLSKSESERFNNGDRNFTHSSIRRCKEFGTQSVATGNSCQHSLPDWHRPWYEVATEFCRVDDGISNRVDRLKGLGNAIVPQAALMIFQIILELEKREQK